MHEQTQKVHQIEEADDSDSAESIEHIDIEVIDQLEHQVHVIKNTKAYADMTVKSTGKKISFHIDLGSSVNILPIKYKPKDAEAVPTNIILKSWTGNKLSPVGTSRMIITNPKNNKK